MGTDGQQILQRDGISKINDWVDLGEHTAFLYSSRQSLDRTHKFIWIYSSLL